MPLTVVFSGVQYSLKICQGKKWKCYFLIEMIELKKKNTCYSGLRTQDPQNSARVAKEDKIAVYFIYIKVQLGKNKLFMNWSNYNCWQQGWINH